jgi:hypothetical protein
VYASLLIALTLAGLALRIWSKDVAYGPFVDEILYATNAETTIANALIPFSIQGTPFFLHPPLVFILGSLAVPEHLAGDSTHMVPALIHSLRWVNIIAGALTIPVVAEIVRRTSDRGTQLLRRSPGRGSRVFALAAALLFAVDPFILRHNGRYLLETVSVGFAMLGYMIVMRAVGKQRLSAGTMILAAGAFGLGILGKDMVAIGVILPLVAAGFMRLGGIGRLRWFILTGLSMALYALYVVYVNTSQYWQAWVDVKTSGVRRALGIEQTTGIHAPGAPNLVQSLAEQSATYWPSYLILALAVPATLYMLFRGTATQRLLSLVATATGAQLLFGLAGGGLEEQFLYFLIVPAILGVAAAASKVVADRTDAGKKIAAFATTSALLVTAMVGANIASQVEIRTNPDIAYNDAVTYLQEHADKNTPIAWAQGTTHYELEQFTFFDWTGGQWALPEKVKAHNVKYIITQSKAIEEGYAYVPRDYLTTVVPKYAHVVFSEDSRWSGSISIWEVDDYVAQPSEATAVAPKSLMRTLQSAGNAQN